MAININSATISDFAIYQIDGYIDRDSIKVRIAQDFCIKSVENYCRKYGIDYIRINTHPNRYNHSLKIDYHRLISGLEYKKLLYLDCDIIIGHDAPNIFDTVDCDVIAGCAFNDNRLAYCKSEILKKFPDLDTGNIFYGYNGGVLLYNLSSDIRKLFTIDEDILDLKDDEIILTYNLIKYNIQSNILDSRWNFRGVTSFNLENELKKNYYIHLCVGSYHENGYHKHIKDNLRDIQQVLTNIMEIK